MIYNIFGSGIYHKTHSILKPKYQEFHNRNIGIFCGNETRMDGYFMVMYSYLRIRKVLQATILSTVFISIPTNNKFDKVVRYINNNKLRERFYVLLKILFPCLSVICLTDSNNSGMEKFYYYSRITKQCIEKTISDIDYKKLFPDILSQTNIWNDSDNESDEEDSLSNGYTEYLDNIYFVISKLWNRIEKHINTDYDVTGWMLCVIPHIREGVFKMHKIDIILR